jgi:rubrerythrin
MYSGLLCMFLTKTIAQLFLVKNYVKPNEEMSNNSENTKLENSTYNILSALGRESDFLYSTVDKYVQDAQSDGRQNLVDLWNEIKQDKQRHLSKLRECLEKEAKDNKLTT